MAHIFLSYSRKDTAVMQRVSADLQSAGLAVWTDEGIELGTPLWKDAIEQAIERAACLVVILSPDAKQSTWVKRELEYAEKHKIRVFSLLARGEESEAVPFALVGSQYADIRQNYATGIQKLITVVAKLAPDEVEAFPVSRNLTAEDIVELLAAERGFNFQALQVNDYGDVGWLGIKVDSVIIYKMLVIPPDRYSLSHLNEVDKRAQDYLAMALHMEPMGQQLAPLTRLFISERGATEEVISYTMRFAFIRDNTWFLDIVNKILYRSKGQDEYNTKVGYFKELDKIEELLQRQGIIHEIIWR